MKQHLLNIANTHANGIARQRAKRLLRLRYNIIIRNDKNKVDPVWLSAYNI